MILEVKGAAIHNLDARTHPTPKKKGPTIKIWKQEHHGSTPDKKKPGSTTWKKGAITLHPKGPIITIRKSKNNNSQ